MGIYFLEKGAAQRPSAVIYDRAGSAMACADPDIYDWDSILADASRFHFSGITPAISAGAARACADALAAAKRLGVKVSCDINYRARLWSTALAAETLAPMLGGIDLLISNESTVRELFGITGVGTAETAENVRRFFGCNSVALTVRRSERDGGELFGGALLRGERFEESPMYRVGGIDRVGAGDAFGGALLYAAEQGADTARAIRFAAAAGCLKHTIEGDAAYLTTDEINVLAEGSADARIRR